MDTMLGGTERTAGYMTEERIMIRETARAFTHAEMLPVANRLDPEKGDIPQELVRKLGEMGYFGILIPEDLGGLGLGAFEYCLVAEQLARGWMSVASLIARGNAFYKRVPGTPEQRAERIAAMAQGRYLGAFAMSEPGAGSDIASISCRAVRDGDEWVITGNKYWCTFADGADFIEVICRTSTPTDPAKRHQGLTAIAVEEEKGRLPDGVLGTPIPKIGYFGWKTWELRFEGTRVPATTLEADVGRAFYAVAAKLETARTHRRALDRSGAGRARGCARLCAGALTVRPADRPLPGDPLQARHDGNRDRGGAAADVLCLQRAVASVARLRRLPTATIAQAFGLALSKAAGSMQYLENGAWNKRLHAGFAAHDAMICVAMAANGVVGAAAPIEGRYGLLASYSSSPDSAILTDALGTRWTLLQTSIKPYPSCRLTHGAIDAALALREQATAVERRNASLKLRISPVSWKITGEPTPGKLAPRNNVDAQFSAYYQTAVAWLHGFPTWQDYDRLAEPDVLGMIERISIDVDPDLRKAGARLTATLGGRQLETTVHTPLGEPDTPFGWDGIVRKFRSMAEPVYGPTADRIIDLVLGVPQLGRMTELAALLRAPAAR